MNTYDKKNEIVMHLVHYFITEENYSPVIVNGVRNEIWLENMNAPYKIIRINSNYIHNNEQLSFDIYKIKNITKQIKKRTLSFNLNTLNILLDINEDVKFTKFKNVDNYKIDDLEDVKKKNNLASIFPKLKKIDLNNKSSEETFIKITNDIAKKSEKDNMEYENIFKPKKVIITKILMGLNIAMFILTLSSNELANLLIINPFAVKSGEIYRLLSGIFMHADIIHLVLNMYALSIIGTQVETYIGKWKYLLVYLFSGICGALLSCAINDSFSLGASGAIFGLLGCLLYFGYHYRVYLGNVLISQIVPIVLMNLVLGFIMPNIDNAAHIGGLVSGLLVTMAVGVNNKDSKLSKINGIITSIILFLFLIFIVFFK